MIPLYSSESASKACLSGLLNTKEVLLGISSISAKTFIFFFLLRLTHCLSFIHSYITDLPAYCLRQLPIAVVNIMIQAIKGGKVYMAQRIQTTIKGNKAGNQRQELKQRTQWDSPYWLALPVFLSNPGPPIQVNTAHSGLGSSHQLLIKTCPKCNLKESILQWKFSLP